MLRSLRRNFACEPIMMTSIAFILGVLPLYFATGAGAYGRHSVGTAIVGGMVLSTVLNLVFIPVLYVILKTVLKALCRVKPKTARYGKRSLHIHRPTDL